MGNSARRTLCVAVVTFLYCVHAHMMDEDEVDAASRAATKRHLLRAAVAKAAGIGAVVGGVGTAISSALASKGPDHDSALLRAGMYTGGGLAIAGVAANIYSHAQFHLAAGETAINYLNKGSERQQNAGTRAAQKLALAAISNVAMSSMTRTPPITAPFLLAGSGYYGLKSVIFPTKVKSKRESKSRPKKTSVTLNASVLPTTLAAFAITAVVVCV
ncbi:Uncharacterized protein PBTT_01209 [Plasmodiophora brassicae]|uniref:Uncharacterized protein n=1 Tax=Plasmodiophora brassicae TaxID=37360 RepID=A0A0G4IZH0_PLABS|nr:hypothetical protein PBRA_001588 [Plasmodiophora brassicae]SPQ93969.1 unnamed protein product [Plasmodiophora brassicae]